MNIKSNAPTCHNARSFLFVPANRPERFQKAVTSGADAVILDLEDAVPVADKESARESIRSSWKGLSSTGVPLVVRINPEGSPMWDADVALVRELHGIAAVMLPKAENSDALARFQELVPGVSVLPLIESAAGYDALRAIAAAPGVSRLVVGHIDFMADTGIACSDDERELDTLRFAVAMATRAAQLAPAVDGVTVQTGDSQRLTTDTRRARRFGFGGKLCIHPHQVSGVHEALAPTDEELSWARRVVAADAMSGGAAVQLDGRMVDLPVVLQARRDLARANAT